jgi:RNA polymerase sigma factor (sigma-70 family)
MTATRSLASPSPTGCRDRDDGEELRQETNDVDAQWRAALDRLTLPERESVILRAQNLTLREIADILQTRPRRVAALLVRAIARLKQALDA